MADLSIKLKTYADLTTFQQSINDISSKVKPIDIKISSNLDKSLLNIDSALGPVSSKITSTYERLSLMRAEGSLSAKSFEDLTAKTHTVQDALAKGNITFDQANKELTNIENSANGVKKGFMGMSQPLSDIIKKFATWYIIAGLVTSAINALKSIVSITIDLDTAFTSIQMVTGYTDEQIKELRQSYIDLAEDMGVTVETVTDAADEWIRAGLSVADATKALKASLILSTIAQMESADATTYLVAAMNGYNLEASELIDLVDKLSAIDVVAATSSEELATALSYSATSAQLAGISLDKYLGMIATVSETTRQSASTIGNSFKSIFARLQQVKIGATLDAGGEDISNVDTILKQYGIDLMSVSDNLTDMGALLDTLGEEWSTYSAAEKSQIAVTVAGVYQRERFLVLMENYERALELEEIALGSSGSAMDKYAIYQESLEAHINSLNSAWVDFVNELDASGFIDFLISIAKGILDVVSGIVSWIDGLGKFGDILKIVIPLLIAATAAIFAFKAIASGGTAIIKGIASLAAITIAVAGFVSSLDDVTKALEDEDEDIKNSTETSTEYSEALKLVKDNLTDITKAIQNKIDLLEEENDVIEEQKELQEKLYDVEQARIALAEAHEGTISAFRVGVGFVNIEDAAEVQSAQEAYSSAVDSLAEYKYELAKERAADFIEELTAMITDGTLIDSWGTLFDEYGDLLDSEFASYLLSAQEFVESFNATVGDSGVQISTSVPTYAEGTDNHEGGLAIVGDKGNDMSHAELVNIPKGSQVIPNSITKNLLSTKEQPSSFIKSSGSEVINNFNGNLEFPNVKNGADADGFLKALMTKVGAYSKLKF